MYACKYFLSIYACTYFPGIDASRALAKMSFKEEDLSSRDLSELTAEQQKTLVDWEKKFIVSRKYPVVGSIID